MKVGDIELPFLTWFCLVLAIVVMLDQYFTHKGILFDPDQILNHEIVFMTLNGIAAGALFQKRYRP
jgi:uncharacterized membrane protein